MPRFALVRIVSLALLLAIISAPLRANAPTDQPFATNADILNWIVGYRDEPQPERLAEAVAAMSRLGVLRDLDKAGVFIGFVAGVIGEHQVEADRLIGTLFPLRPEDQVIVIRAIADSGLPDWQAILSRFAERMPARKILIRAYLDGSRKPVQESALDAAPDVLDTWWGLYFASGRYEPVTRILPALAWVDEADNLDRLTIASMAKWTLAANASRDKPLLDFLRAEAYRQSGAIALPLRDLVLAAETFEVGRIRKEQVAKMEELKARGPSKGRQWAWWSRAASTAIALGCVVAGAAGQVQFGLPCLVGGTVSSAAERWLTQPR